MKFRICDGLQERVVPASIEVVEQVFAPGVPMRPGTEISLVDGERSLVAIALGTPSTGGDDDREEFLLTSTHRADAALSGPVGRREVLRRCREFVLARARRVLVTGATGKIGSQLVPRLAAYAGIMVRAFARNTEKAAPLVASGAELAVGTLEDGQAVRAALDGIDTVVSITAASPMAASQASALVAAAREARVRKIVRISVFKAAADGPTDITRQHGRTDGEIQGSGLTYTILRPPFFMQNLCTMAAPTIASVGKLYFGTGDGKLAMIDLRDVVDCAEQCVVSDTWDNQVFTLTGPESISFHDIANRLTDILGRPVDYIPVPPEAVEQSIRARGMGEWYARVMRDLCRAYSENWGDLATDSVAQITGRAPRSFDAFAREIMVPALVLQPSQRATLTGPLR
jgi:uncharacterized protein YbjT (DUF2867 family)